MTGRKKHSVWLYFDEEITEGKTKRAVCKACKVSMVALVERMLKHKVTYCTFGKGGNANNDTIEQYSGGGVFEEKPIVHEGVADDWYETTEALDSNFNNGNYYLNVVYFVFVFLFRTSCNIVLFVFVFFLTVNNKYNNDDGSLAPHYGRRLFRTCDDEVANLTTAAVNDLLDAQVARMVFATNCSFRITEHPEFKAMIELLRPGYVPPSSFKIANDLLYKTYNARRSQNVTGTFRDKCVCMSIEGSSSDDSAIRVSLHNVEEQTQCPITIVYDKSFLSRTPQYYRDLALKSVRECSQRFNCKVIGLVADCAVDDLREMHEYLVAKCTDLKCKNILVYSCISKTLELLSNDLQIPSVTEHLKRIINYFNIWPIDQGKYGTAAGKTGLFLPFEAKSDSLIHKLEYYILTWHNIMENRNAKNGVNHMDSKHHNQCLEKLKKLSLAFVRSQSDTCTIGEATEVWLDLINQLKNEGDMIKIKTVKRFEMATTPAHYLANILDPRYEGKKLDKSQMNKALDFVAKYHPEVMPDLIEYLAHSGPYKNFLFTAASRGNRSVKPIVWWKSLENTNQNRISEQMFVLNKQLHSTIASSSGSECLFSMFGFVHNKVRNSNTDKVSNQLVY